MLLGLYIDQLLNQSKSEQKGLDLANKAIKMNLVFFARNIQPAKEIELEWYQGTILFLTPSVEIGQDSHYGNSWDKLMT